MRIVIIPSLTELRIKINPSEKAIWEEGTDVVLPWMFAPCPEAKSKGMIETDIECSTLRALLNGLSCYYRKAGIELELINPKRNDVDFDYEVFVNGEKYIDLPLGLETKLKKGNEVVVKMVMLFDG